jgi:hypothetical protein
MHLMVLPAPVWEGVEWPLLRDKLIPFNRLHVGKAIPAEEWPLVREVLYSQVTKRPQLNATTLTLIL